MPRRFLLRQPLDVPRVVLTGGEAHHLTNVLRRQVGDEVLLFDGEGTEARARILSLGGTGGSADLEILSHGPAETETRQPIILGTAVPKGDRFEWLVEKVTELGVARLVPLVTERSIVNPGAGKLDKLRHAVVGASKQSGRSRLMEIETPISWGEFLTRYGGQNLFIADPSGDSVHGLDWGGDVPIVFAIGPEGGLTERELTTAIAAGARLISLGPRILRIETAAVALATLISTSLNESGGSPLV